MPYQMVPTLCWYQRSYFGRDSTNTTLRRALDYQLYKGPNKIKGRLNLLKCWRIPPPRDHNDYIMSVFRWDQSLTTKEVITLKYCQYQLGIEHLFDIVTTEGKNLLPQLQQAIPTAPQNQQETLFYPTQGPLPPAAWKLRHKAMQNSVCDKRGFLRQPLGSWKYMYTLWKAYLDEKFNVVYMHNGQQWTMVHINFQNRSMIQVTNQHSVCPRPANLYHLLPITDLKSLPHEQALRCTHEKAIKTLVQKKTKRVAQSFLKYIKDIEEEWEQKLLTYVWERHQSIINLKTFLQLGGKLWITSDGRVTDGL
eukprot:11036604-Ditylum_brightwellii.AAC.1